MATFGIGEAARRAGVSADLIRYYERAGILPPAPRTANGYRVYSEDTLARVVFARNAIRFGFSAKELAGFFKARAKGQPPCRSVHAAGKRLLDEMDARLAALREARKALAATVAAWDQRLADTPAGTPAHLLTMIPELPKRITSGKLGNRTSSGRPARNV
jgi:DNA-binding transcriptional MerR regulator